MKTNITSSSGGYSIIAAVLMVGFLLILTTSTLNLVLQEMQDGKWRQWYLQSYAWAEAGLELALLNIKKQWYWYDDDSFFEKELFWSFPKYPKVSYEFNSRVQSHSGTLAPRGIDIIPLFASWELWDEFTNTLNFVVDSWDIVWNIWRGLSYYTEPFFYRCIIHFKYFLSIYAPKSRDFLKCESMKIQAKS